MKLIFAILLFLVASNFVTAQAIRPANSGSSQRSFFCTDAESNVIRIEGDDAQRISKQCEDVRRNEKESCLQKAESVYCRAKVNPVPLYGDLKEIPNKLSCEEFANRFLEKRKLGTLSKPSASVTMARPLQKSESGQPIFEFKIQGNSNATVEGKWVEDTTGKELWELDVTANTNLPSFEPPYKISTANLLAAKDKTKKGKYVRSYKFSIVDNVCVLNKVETYFTPEAPKGQENSPKYAQQQSHLSQNDCGIQSSLIYAEKLYKNISISQEVDVQNSWVCNESVVSFNVPEAKVTNRQRAGRGQKPAQSNP